MIDIIKRLFRKSEDDGRETEVAAAIAAALAMYEGDGIHDKESYVITIRRR